MSPWLAFGIVLGGITLAAITRRICDRRRP